MSNKKKCNFCGSSSYEVKRTEYLYKHNGKYLLVPNTPVETCNKCGMSYYDAKVLKEIEQFFFDIESQHKKPDNYIQIPMKSYGASAQV